MALIGVLLEVVSAKPKVTVKSSSRIAAHSRSRQYLGQDRKIKNGRGSGLKYPMPNADGTLMPMARFNVV